MWFLNLSVDVTLCREEAERNRIVSHAHRHQLLVSGRANEVFCTLVEILILQCIDRCLFLQHVGLQGLLLHVNRNKAHRLNSNMAVQHYHQSVIGVLHHANATVSANVSKNERSIFHRWHVTIGGCGRTVWRRLKTRAFDPYMKWQWLTTGAFIYISFP